MTLERLLDTERALEPGEQRLAELVRGVDAFHPNPFRKRWVMQQVTRGAALPKTWLGMPGSSWAAVAAVGGVGIAAATYGLLHDESASAPPHTAAKPVVAAVLPVPPRPETTPVVPATPPQPRTEAPRAPAAPAKPVREARAKATADGEDPTRVLEAVRALRKRGDAARAQVLLDEYLSENPGGALTEDALALAIEAASARKDPRAAAYAKRYLARFPAGRFRAVALKASGK